MRHVTALVAASAALLLASAPAGFASAAAPATTAAAPAAKPGACRDAKGKFVACPKTKVASTGQRCRDAKGKFVKCAAPTGVAANTSATVSTSKPVKKH
jgi:hypothetical protein